MKVTFKQRKGTVKFERRMVDSFDPTMVETIIVTRNDGRIFKVVGAYDGWHCSGESQREGASGKVYIASYSDLRAWFKLHSLPSFNWLESQLEDYYQGVEEDPMGSLADYV